jgi:hypothetical protein
MKVEGEHSRQIIASIGPDGKVTYTNPPDVRQLDYITRALKSVADKEDASGKMGGQTALGRAYGNLAGQIRDTLKTAVPEYGKALDVASDAISRTKATDLGYAMLRDSTKREEVAMGLKGASNAERDAAKQGLRTFIDDQMAAIKATLADPDTALREAQKGFTMLSSRAAKDKMEMLLGKDAAAKMLSAIDQERTAFELRAAIAKGSQTYMRTAINGVTKQVTGPTLTETLTDGSVQQAAKRLVQVFTGSSQEAAAIRQMGVNAEIAQALTTIRGPAADEAMKIISRAQTKGVMTDNEATFLAGVLQRAIRNSAPSATNSITSRMGPK